MQMKRRISRLYIRGQKPRHQWRGWVFGRSVFRSEKPWALARGASLLISAVVISVFSFGANAQAVAQYVSVQYGFF